MCRFGEIRPLNANGKREPPDRTVWGFVWQQKLGLSNDVVQTVVTNHNFQRIDRKIEHPLGLFL